MSFNNTTYQRGRRIQDSQWTASDALPNAASTTVSGTVIDLDSGSARTNFGELPENIEAVIQIPALTTTMLPDTRTLTVTLLGGDTNNPATQIGEAIVITGAGGAGAPANEAHFRFAPAGHRYVRAQYVTGASATDQSALKGTLFIGF